MNPTVVTILWTVGSLLLVGFFAGMEVAFVSANRLNIELKKKQGKSSGAILSHFIEEPSKYFGTTLVGINLSMVAYALLLSGLLTPLYVQVGIENEYLVLLLNIFIPTVVVLLFGDFIPKAIFRGKNDQLLSFFSPVIRFFYKILYPFAALLVKVAEWILQYVFNVRIHDRIATMGKSDMEHFFLQNKVPDDDNQEVNSELLENALSLPMVKIRQCLVPRTEIEGLDLNTPLEDVKKKMIDTKLSKLVVYSENIDNIQGYIHQLDFFKNPPDLQSILLPIPAVPESMSATDLINKFSKERKSIAWVVDEFGGTAGIVTMEDILEEIFGEIKDEYDVEEFVEKQIAEDEYIFSGRLEIDYLNEKYNLEFSLEESETLSGYIIAEYKSIPQQKERIIIDRYEFEVLNVSDTRIEMVKIKVLR